MLAAVIEHINRRTGVAFPKVSTLADEIVNYVNGLPEQHRLPALHNAVTLVRQCGYFVTEKRASQAGFKAVAHYATTYPTPEEKRAGIQAWSGEKQGKEPDLTHGVKSADFTGGVRSGANLTGGMNSGGADFTRRQGLTSPGDRKSGGATHYTEPDSINPKAPSGADALALASGTKRRKPSKPLATPKEIDEALAAYNAVAEAHGFTSCRILTDPRRGRLGERLPQIGGLDAFKQALTALPRNDFLMGRVPPKPGQRPFKLDIDQLLSTGSGLGDVLARLIDAAASPAAETKPKPISRY